MLGQGWLLIVAGSALLPLSAATASDDQSRPVRPLENPGTWVRDDEVPTAARGESGSVTLNLDVAPSGEVSGCTVVETNVSAMLGEAFCAMIKRHGRFAAARDASGRPISATYLMPGIRYSHR
jgi:protein TonB